MSFKITVISVVLMFCVVQAILAAPPKKFDIVEAGSEKSIDNATYINANNILMFVTNHGNFARDLSDVFGYDAGTFYPFTTVEAIEAGINSSYVLYAAGLWIGGMVNGEIRIAIAEYSDEYVPGPMAGGTYIPDNPDFRVYKLYSDSLAGNPNIDYINWPATQGAPVRSDGTPRMFGDQTLWTVYNDADPTQHYNNAGETAPLGLEIRQTIWAAEEDNVYDTVLHVGEPQILKVGVADFSFHIEVADVDDILEGRQYEVTFEDIGSGMFVWNIIDATLGIVKVDDRPLPTDGSDEVTVDGLNFVILPLIPGIERIEEMANGNGPLNPPDNVMYSLNSTSDWFISSDAGSDFSRMNWRGLMGEADWEIRFTYSGSQYYDWNTDQLQPDRAPFEVWNIGEGTQDDPSDDVRINFSFIDDDASMDWNWGDRLYPWEVPYVEPLPAIANYVFPDDFRIGRIVFRDYSGMLQYPEEGTIVRFTSHKIIPISEQDTVYITAPQVYVDYVGEKSDEIFIAYEIHNKGGNTIEDCYISLWTDPDLGGAGDDLVACDPADNVFYCYNGDGNDQQYGLTPPALGFKVISGPLYYAPGEVGDYFGNEVLNYKNHGLTAFSKYINGTDPDNYQETYNYMRGLNRDGSPYTYDGVPTTFQMAGDPVAGTGDLDVAPADRRMMGSFGPMTMNPGDSQFVLIKMAIGRSGDYLSSITNLRNKLNRPFTYPEDVVEPDSWHVATDGSNSTGDGSAANPFATIQYAVNTAVDGDIIVIHPGVYTGAGNRDILVEGKSLTIKGTSYPESTVIDCEGASGDPHYGFKFVDCNGTPLLAGITITDSYLNGQGNDGSVIAINSNLAVSRCDIIENNAIGIYSLHEEGTLSVSYSDISRNAFSGINSFNLACQVEYSKINGNSYSGIGSYGFQPKSTTVNNCEITGNGLNGLEIMYPSNAWLSRNTIVNNRTGLLYFMEPPKTADLKLSPVIQVNNNIFAYNSDYGISEDFLSLPLQMHCNLFYNNLQGDLSGLEFDQDDADNLFESPQFCSISEHNYYLRETSPCMSSNNVCGSIIGAYGLSSNECDPGGLISLFQWRKEDGGNDHWYGVYPVPSFWVQADSAAGTFIQNDSDTGYLATIGSPEENDFILNVILDDLNPPTIENQFWLGGRDTDGEGNWTWVSDESFSFQNWAPGEPNNPGVETALTMYGEFNSDPKIPGTWNNSLADDAIHPLHQYYGVIEFGKPSQDILHPTNEWVNLHCEAPVFNENPLEYGDVIRAYDTDMNLCGIDTVDADGSFGFMPIYRDYSGSEIDEGMDPGETIRFTINDVLAASEPPTVWTAMGDGIEVCTFTNLLDMEIPLNEGWNLISWNLDNPEEDIEEIIGSFAGDVELILGFEGGGLTYDPLLPVFSTLSTLDHYHGYWFKMTAPAQLNIRGYLLENSDFIALEEGWNLISYWPTDDFAVPSALSSIYEDVNLVLGWRDGQPQTFDPVLPDYSTLDFMSEGFGYWVRMNEANYLSYSGGVPKATLRNFAAAPDYVTRIWTNIYSRNLTLDDEIIPRGTVIKALNSEGKTLGEGIVGEGGKFGFMPVYGDDPSTEITEGISSGEEFYLKVGEVETADRFIWNSDILVSEIVGLKSVNALPTEYALTQNYPNPFNPETNIEFSLPQEEHVTLTIFDILGRLVTTLVDRKMDAGNHSITWSGTDDRGKQVSTGLYFYRIKAGSFEQAKKMMLLK